MVEIPYRIMLQKSVAAEGGEYEWKSSGNSKSSSQIIDNEKELNLIQVLTIEFFKNNTLEEGIIYLYHLDFNINNYEIKVEIFIGYRDGKIFVHDSTTSDNRYGVYLFINNVADPGASRQSGGGNFKQHLKNMDRVVREYL